MAAFSDRSSVSRDNEDVKPTIKSSFAQHSQASPGGKFSRRVSTDMLENSDLKVEIEVLDGALLESPPRMTIDGTCAPPRIPYSSFLYSLGLPATSPYSSPPTSQARVFSVRMSTGGKAPCLALSCQKRSLPSVIQGAVPTTSPFAERAITSARTSDRSSSEASTRGSSATTEVTVKRPRGRPRKTIQPQSNLHNMPLNHSVSIPQYGNKPRVGPKKGTASRSENLMVKPGKMFWESSASKSEDPMKRPRGRPKKMFSSKSENPVVKPGEMPWKSSASKLEDTMKRPQGKPTKGSTITSEVPMKRPVGRPKASGKKHRALPQAKSFFVSTILREPFVLLTRWTQKNEVSLSRSVGQAAGILASVKERRPVGRPRKRRPVSRGYPRKSVSDAASRNQDEVESQMISLVMSFKQGR